jgi:hypothetical protein
MAVTDPAPISLKAMSGFNILSFFPIADDICGYE